MKLTEEQQDRLKQLIYEDYVDELPEEQWQSHREALFCQIEDSYELHAFAETYNWDGGIDDLKKVIESPLCDKATALMIYGLAEPGYYYRKQEKGGKFREYELSVWEFLRLIESRIAEGAFTEGLIAYDPTDFHGGHVFRVNSANPGNKLIPDFMKVGTAGDVIENAPI